MDNSNFHSKLQGKLLAVRLILYFFDLKSDITLNTSFGLLEILCGIIQNTFWNNSEYVRDYSKYICGIFINKEPD